MKRRTVTAFSAAVVLAVAGCSDTGGQAEAPTMEATQQSERTAEPTPEATAAEPEPATTRATDVMAACDALWGGDDSLMERVPGLLIDMPTSMNQDTARPYLDANMEFMAALRHAPDEMVPHVETVQAPFLAIYEAYTSGSSQGQSIQSDTSGVFDATTEINGVETMVTTDCEAAGGTEFTPVALPDLTDGASEDVVVEPLVVTRSDVQSLLVHSGSLQIQPDRSWVLVNAETIAMTDAAEHVLGTQVLGFDVDVRVTPALFSWDFGDGADPIVGTDPGAPWPDHTVSHVYRGEGTAVITLRTEWDAAFRVEGTGDWFPVDGRAVTVTTSDPIDVVSATPRLTNGR